MNKDTALRLALEALESGVKTKANRLEWIEYDCELVEQAVTAIKAALLSRSDGEAKDEPVAIDGNTSDGYHTFNELYEFRKAYNVALFNEWASNGKCSVHKSWRHNDGELCFGGGWFIVVAVLPQGQISNHYEAKDWGLFSVLETERALFEFDGHTGSDVVERLKSYAPPQQETKDEPVAWDGYNLDDMCEAFNRVIEEHFHRKHPFHDPVNNDAMIALRTLRGFIPYMKRHTTPPQRKPLTDKQIEAIAKEHIAVGTRSFEEFARRIEAAHGIKGEA